MSDLYDILSGRPMRATDRDGLKVAEDSVSESSSKGIDMASQVDNLSQAVGDGLSLEVDAYTGPLPEEHERFDPLRVEKIIKDHLDAYLHNVKYDSGRCAQLAHDMCRLIKDKTKELRYRRYKLVTQVLVGQDSDESVHMAARCLWNHRSDNFAAATYRNASIYAVGIVYGMYLE